MPEACRGDILARSRGFEVVGGAVALTALLLVAVLAFAGAASAKKGSTVWLCRPGTTPDPCTASREATVVNYASGSRQESVVAAEKSHKKPPIDCFYVYPTVSEQEGPNANLDIEPQETQIAIDQASRFSQVCRVFAPMYPQLTLQAIKTPGEITLEDEGKAFGGVLGAFQEYLQKYNKGRGIVLIGHSQGSAMLEALMEQTFDTNPELRKRLVSAIILGGNVLVPEGQREGGTFKNIPSCAEAQETGCVIAYSSFLKEPPEVSFFGRPSSPLLGGPPPPPGVEVLCVNPTLLNQNGGVGNLQPYAPTTEFPGVIGAGSPVPSASTPWVETLGVATAQCKHENGATWLNIAFKEGLGPTTIEELKTKHEAAEELIGPEWGLHLYDVNIALGNLVHTVAIESQAYAFED